ncbi:MAG: hypothetical protein IM631_00015 [Cytophagales bacterium]|nr:hypothetical protein [Cytophagales bacterium]MCA6369751.1 hypothetical protein [Cytophagales bacterium]MCA6377281.1 hypothetical protein [Cytophagales bacterium]MCA6386087.1 hypothetical protein [Cytophagales bacterium]
MEKLSTKTYYIFAILFTGCIGYAINQEFLTPASLSESLLIICGLGYIVSKYYSSKIIQKYQDNNYQPTNSTRRRDDFAVGVYTKIIMPLSLDFSYSALFLFGLKFIIPLSMFPLIGNSIFSLYDLNKTYIKSPTTFFFIILAILALTQFITYSSRKQVKKVWKLISFPFKLASILIYFLQADDGVASKIIAFSINKEPVTGNQLTFATHNYSYTKAIDHQAEKENQQGDNKEEDEDNSNDLSFPLKPLVNQCIEKYIDYVIAQMESGSDPESSGSPPSGNLYASLERISGVIQKLPALENEVFVNYKNSDGGEVEFINNLENFRSSVLPQKVIKVEKSVPNNLLTILKSKDESFFRNFISLMESESESIREPKYNEHTKIMKELLRKAFGKYLPFDMVESFLPFHQLVNGPIVDELQNKVVNSFYYLLKKPQLAKKHLSDISIFLKHNLDKKYIALKKGLDKMSGAFNKYYSTLKESTYNFFFSKKDTEKSATVLSYEEGLKRRKQVLVYKINNFDREQLKKQMAEQIPDVTINEESIAFYENQIKSSYSEKIKRIEEVLSDKSLLQSYDHAKNFQSPGGIFFGMALKDADTYFQEHDSPDNSGWLDPNKVVSIAIVAKGTNQFLLTLYSVDHTELVLKEAVNPKTFLAAYSFINGTDPYPTVVDGFFDEADRKVFSYNRNILYDQQITNTAKEADEFIFGVLTEKISGNELVKRFRYSIINNKSKTERVDFSRIFDTHHCLFMHDNKTVDFHSDIKFSVARNGKTGIEEVESLSQEFNKESEWIFQNYHYLNEMRNFARYQALIRTLEKDKIDLLDAILAEL